jgi:hypothetical protein
MAVKEGKGSDREGTSGLERRLFDSKKAVLRRWMQAVIATYPAETASFLGSDGKTGEVGVRK